MTQSVRPNYDVASNPVLFADRVDFDTTPANIHDNNIDLSESNDISMYRDRGYSGRDLKYPQVNDRTMIRKDKNKDWVIATNKAISKIRVMGERQFSVIKYVFKGGHTYVKSLSRVKIGQLFSYFAYNLYNLFTYRKKILPSGS